MEPALAIGLAVAVHSCLIRRVVRLLSDGDELLQEGLGLAQVPFGFHEFFGLGWLHASASVVKLVEPTHFFIEVSASFIRTEFRLLDPQRVRLIKLLFQASHVHLELFLAVVDCRLLQDLATRILQVIVFVVPLLPVPVNRCS